MNKAVYSWTARQNELVLLLLLKTHTVRIYFLGWSKSFEEKKNSRTLPFGYPIYGMTKLFRIIQISVPKLPVFNCRKITYYYYVWGWIIFTSELQLKVNLFSKIRFHKYTQGEFVFLYDKFVVFWLVSNLYPFR